MNKGCVKDGSFCLLSEMGERMNEESEDHRPAGKLVFFLVVEAIKHIFG